MLQFIIEYNGKVVASTQEINMNAKQQIVVQEDIFGFLIFLLKVV